MQSHLLEKQTLVEEQQSLLWQQAAVLQEHVRAGIALPVSASSVLLPWTCGHAAEAVFMLFAGQRAACWMCCSRLWCWC